MTNRVDLTYHLFCKASEAEDKGHLDETARIYTSAAQRRDAPSQLNLGTLFDNHLQPRQPRKAIYWYMQAVRADYASEAWNLAMRYVPRQNHRRYRFFMAKAEAMGDEDAAIEMAQIRLDDTYITQLS